MRVIMRFSMPILVGNLAQQLFETVDAVIVGKFSAQHDAALSAIAAVGSIHNLLMIPFLAIATSVGIYAAQLFGAKDGERLKRTISTSITMVALFAAVIAVLGLASAPWLLRTIQTPEAVMPLAREYMAVTLIGLCAGGLYMVVAGILRGMGDAFWPLFFLLVAVLLNLGLDAWFVVGLRWGLVGAGWAGVLSQVAATALCLARLRRMMVINGIRVQRGDARVDPPMAGHLMRLGIPAAIAQGALSIGILMLQSLTNRMGQDAIVASMAIMRVDGFAMLHCFTFGHAVATFAGQNIGAKRMDRVGQGVHDALLLSLLISLVMALALMLFGRHMVNWFSDTPRVAELGAQAFRILAASYLALSIAQVFGGLIRGAGDMLPNMWITIGVHFLVRVPVAYLAAGLSSSPDWPYGSPEALFYSLLATRLVTAVANYYWCKRDGWQKVSLIEAG